jgi:hypothetical protein
MSTKPIVLGGRSYRSVEEMPPDVREKYELAMCLLGDPDENNLLHTVESLNSSADQNRDREPQGLENIAAASLTTDNMQTIPDGQELQSLEDLPSKAHSRYDRPKPARSAVLSPAKPLQTSPMIMPDTSEGWSLAFAALFLLILCALAMTGVWYFFR